MYHDEMFVTWKTFIHFTAITTIQLISNTWKHIFSFKHTMSMQSQAANTAVLLWFECLNVQQTSQEAKNFTQFFPNKQCKVSNAAACR